MNINLIRNEYPILKSKIQLSSCSQSALHIDVKKGLEAYVNSWEKEGMDWLTWMEICEESRSKFAKLINAKPTEIAIVTSLSHAISSVVMSLPQQEDRKNIVLSDMEFPTIGHVTKSQDFFNILFSNINNYENTIDEHTMLTSIPHVSYYNGEIFDIKKAAEIAHSKGSYLFVDAYQSAGQVEIDVKESDVDFLAAGLQKYLLGTPGIAYLYIKEEIANQLTPKITGWFGQKQPFAFDVKNIEYADGARRFDSGTFPMINGFAANNALEIVLNVGVDKIQSHIQKLSIFAMDYCKRVDLEVASPKKVEVKASNTAIKIKNASKVEEVLKERGILVSARNDVIRIAPHYYNTENDIARAIDEIVRIIK